MSQLRPLTLTLPLLWGQLTGLVGVRLKNTFGIYRQQVAPSGGKINIIWRPLAQNNHQVAQTGRLLAAMTRTG
jgi:ABC-type uncharacterized transport system permease subunit